jgi:hypothetical protein
MDIAATLPAPLAVATGLPITARDREAAVQTLAPAPSAPGLPPVERIVQGEWLGRDSAGGAVAGHYLHARVFDAFNFQMPAPPAGPAPVGAGERAVNAYLGHTREGLRHAVTRGRSVDYFL